MNRRSQELFNELSQGSETVSISAFQDYLIRSNLEERAIEYVISSCPSSPLSLLDFESLIKKLSTFDSPVQSSLFLTALDESPESPSPTSFSPPPMSQHTPSRLNTSSFRPSKLASLTPHASPFHEVHHDCELLHRESRDQLKQLQDLYVRISKILKNHLNDEKELLSQNKNFRAEVNFLVERVKNLESEKLSLEGHVKNLELTLSDSQQQLRVKEKGESVSSVGKVDFNCLIDRINGLSHQISELKFRKPIRRTFDLRILFNLFLFIVFILFLFKTNPHRYS
ncbi:hypothetical protein RCL1_008715 [Eukaryota sp. TZLM3-RCL]